MHYGLFINLIFSFAHTFSSSLGGYLENILGFFQTIIVGFSIIFLSNLAFIFQQNIWLCYALTFILGIGVGIGISLIRKNITFYVPNKKGLVVGIFGLLVTIIGGGFGFAGEKIINFEGYTLKEDEEFYPKNIAEKTNIYFLVGECFLPVGLFFALLLIYEFKPEYYKEEEPNEENKEEKLVSDSSMSRSNEEDLNNNQENQITERIDNKNDLKNDNSKNNIKQAIKTFRYWRITLILFFMNFSISFMISTGRTFGALIGIDGMLYNMLEYSKLLYQ
jgi:MFS family permease